MGNVEEYRSSIAIVEKHQVMQVVLQRVVESIGGDVVFNSDSLWVLKNKLEQGFKIHLCIIDLSPPWQQLLKHISSLKEQYSAIKWLGISINSSEGIRLEAIAVGLDAFYCKLEPIERLRMLIGQLTDTEA